MRERKSIRAELKADDSGEFSAVFLTKNVIDKDGDVTLDGAFADGTKVVVGAWQHEMSDLPIGSATIREGKDEVSVEGKFFLDTPQGDAAHRTIKALADEGLGEWSFIFKAAEFKFGEHDDQPVRFLEKIDVFSVDPVLVGAGVNTRTTGIKGGGDLLTFAEHSDAMVQSLNEYLARAKSRAELRGHDGRSLSEANRETLGKLADSLADIQTALDTLTPEEVKDSHPALMHELLRFRAFEAQGA